jgi:hypothetical protein
MHETLTVARDRRGRSAVMTYRVICQYLPDAAVHAVGRPGRGAWRVVACMRAKSVSLAVSHPVSLSLPILVMTSHRYRQPNSWCSPRKILAEWQQDHRRQLAEDWYNSLWQERGCERGPLVRPWA